MKFADCKTWQNRERFELQNRTSVDSFLLFYFINFFQPRHILEIGFSEGYTCGLYLEANNNTKIDCVDLNFNKTKIFDFLPGQERVRLINADSRTVALDQKYDFINVDANHDYEFAKKDIEKSLQYLNPQGIVMIDDFDHPGVWQALIESVQANQLIPLIKTTQSLLCMQSGANVILIPYLNQIKDLANEFLFLDQIQIDKFWVQHLHGPKIWTRFPELFAQTIKLYDL